MEITGKRGRIVPVLLTRDMVETIDICISVRPKFIQNTSNHYVFAVSNGKRSTTGWAALKTIVSKIPDLECSESITSTKLRKYLATMSQVVCLR